LFDYRVQELGMACKVVECDAGRFVVESTSRKMEKLQSRLTIDLVVFLVIVGLVITIILIASLPALELLWTPMPPWYIFVACLPTFSLIGIKYLRAPLRKTTEINKSSKEIRITVVPRAGKRWQFIIPFDRVMQINTSARIDRIFLDFTLKPGIHWKPWIYHLYHGPPIETIPDFESYMRELFGRK
jgi:hypothetical protein